ncbi:hypothetical protein Tco_0093371 [Tanacetum coccineum]
MENVNHDDEVPVVEPNQHNDVPVVPEPVLEDEDEDPEEEEFKEEEEDPQEEEYDMEVHIEKDENEPELTCPYEETDSLNPPPPASESEPNNEIEVENLIKHEDETIPVSVYEVGVSSTTAIPREDGDRLLPGFMRRDINSLFGRMVNFSRQMCGRKTAYALVEKKSEANDKFYGKLILDLGNCDNRDLSRYHFEVYGHLIFSVFEFGVKYSIRSRVVIMDMKDVLLGIALASGEHHEDVKAEIVSKIPLGMHLEFAPEFFMFSPTRKKSRWGTVFPTGLKRYMEPLVEPKEIG